MKNFYYFDAKKKVYFEKQKIKLVTHADVISLEKTSRLAC